MYSKMLRKDAKWQFEEYEKFLGHNLTAINFNKLQMSPLNPISKT